MEEIFPQKNLFPGASQRKGEDWGLNFRGRVSHILRRTLIFPPFGVGSDLRGASLLAFFFSLY